MEIWKPVVGYEDCYEVSNFGTVKRIKKGPNTFVGKILKPYLNKETKYYYIGLGGRNNVHLHRIVATAFFGKSDLYINHKNGVRTDNRVENLEYVTMQENLLHACRVLGERRGEKHWNRKLSESDVKTILSLRGEKTHQEIANQFNVNRATITEILSGRKWKHITNASLQLP